LATSIEDIVRGMDPRALLALDKLSAEDDEKLTRTYQILGDMGYDDCAQNQIVYEVWENKLWKNTKFREMVLLGIEERTLLRLCSSPDAPVAWSNLGTNKKRAQVLSREPFAPRKSPWQRRLMHHLGIGNTSSHQGVQASINSPIKSLKVGARLHDLRDFQQEVVKGIRKRLSSADAARSVVCLPTGAGKTRVTIEAVLEHAQSLPSGLVVLWVAGIKELCRQAEWTLGAVFEDTGLREMKIEHDRLSIVSYFDAALSEEFFQMRRADLGVLTFIMATPHQLDRRKGKESWDWISENVDVIVVDEAHGAREEWGRITNDLSKSADIFALTATPDALSFDSAFGDDWILPERTLGTSKTMLEALVDNKILARRIDDHRTVEEFAWKHGKGDQLDDSGANIESPLWYECLRDIVIDEISRSEDTVLVYVDRIEQARTLSALVNIHFSSRGNQRRCGAVWGAMNPRSRRDRVAEFIRKDSDLRGLVNVRLLTQGFDAPKIGSVVIARETDPETALYRQMVGRGLRGKEFGGTPECRVIRVS